jgi:beta-lactam-binding protein with PASTA domain
MNIQNYLWILPFCSFTGGYFILQSIFSIPNIPAPHLIGKHVHEALPIISTHKLTLRLINQKEEPNIPAGVIVNQTPSPGTSIKPNQTLFIVTTKKPSVITTPACIGKNITTIEQEIKNTPITTRTYYLAHYYPNNTCFAQSPLENEPLEKNQLILYVSAGDNQPIIWPNFINASLESVTEFLNDYHIKPYIINDAPSLDHHNAIIIEQRPLAGTLLTINTHNNQPPSVQLRVSSRNT